MRDNTSRSVRFALLCLVLAALSPVAGCDDEKKEEGAVDVQASRDPEVAASGAIEQLVAPADVVVFGGSENLTALTQALAKAAGPMGQALQTGAISQALTARYGLKDTSAIALDKPARFAMVDPKKNPNGAALILSTTGRDKLLAALPDKKNDVDGNAHAFTSNARTTYLNFIDDFAVLSEDKALFAAQRGFLVKLAGAKVSRPATVVVSAKNAATLYKTEIDLAIAEMEKQVTAQQAMPMGGAGMGQMLRWMASVAHDLDIVSLHLDTLEDGAALAIDISAKKESALEKSFLALGARKLALLEKVPADAPLVIGMSIDPDGDDELRRSLTSWSLQLSFGANADPKYGEAMDEYWKASSGEMAFAAHKTQGKEMLSLTALMGIRDAEKARKAQATLRAMYDAPDFAKMYAGMGLKLKYANDAYKIGDVKVSTVTAELEGAGQNPALQGNDTAALLSNLLSSHVAIGNDLSVVAYGKDAKPLMEAWLGGKMPGGFDKSPGLQRALKSAAKGMFFIGYAVPLDVVQGFGLAQVPGAAPGGAGIALSGGAEQGVLHIVLDVPTAQAMAIAAVMPRGF